MAERVDLDWAGGYLTGRTTNGLGQPLGIDATLAMAAELRVARDVVKVAPPPFLLRALADWLDLEDQRKNRTGDEAQRDLRALADALDALAAFDRHAAPSTPDRPGGS